MFYTRMGLWGITAFMASLPLDMYLWAALEKWFGITSDSLILMLALPVCCMIAGGVAGELYDKREMYEERVKKIKKWFLIEMPVILLINILAILLLASDARAHLP